MRYNYTEIEKKWQKKWYEEKTFKASNEDLSKPKFYALVEFPYPSGHGLHVGHPRGYTALDIVSRKRRLEGYNVLYPMGWDAFGLPTENYAMKNKIHPKKVTADNVANFKKQLQSLGFSFDWDREINTTDSDYYKWTQWIFLKLFEKGLAYKQEMPINWCTSCKVGLSNEEVVDGVCERCGSEVVQKRKSQWMLKITEYAQRLIDDLDDLDFIEKVKTQQKNWIGRSQGAEVTFKIDGADEELVVYTTRPDTLFGATYVVLSPEHPYIDEWKDKIENFSKVVEYRQMAAKKSEFERTELAKEKTGVALEGIYAINPVNGKKLPVWTSDYVLMTYGTGAIMAVPAHDTRDWEFAKKFNLPIIEVVSGGKNVQEEAYTDVSEGTMVNSGFLTGKSVKEAIDAIIDYLEKNKLGKRKVNFKLRDWVFSRQRYWGEPIPLVYCEKCGWVALPESELPLTLPELEDYEPTDNGESPLAKMTDWVNTTCPHCHGPAKRETDTMPQWAGSSWYFLRYIDPKNCDVLADNELLNYWLPIDWYNGGMEHTTLHLLYSRFWHKFLYDIGVVPTKEPYQKRTSHGMILGANNEKMSKSRGNVVNPDDVVRDFGADTFRTYEMFIGAFDQATPWSEQGVKGCYKFLERVWNLQNIVTDDEGYSADLESAMHKAIKKVSEDIERMKFNTAIATLMSLVNDFTKKNSITKGELKTFLQLLNPTAPHITEEMWQLTGFEGEIATSTWPVYDEAKTIDNEVEIVLQINGKIRDKLTIPAGLDKDATQEAAMKSEKVIAAIDGKQVVKIIVVPGKLVNIVVK
ncbi:MAG: leucine--tRNA ligase [Ruminococcaceae bacterium]|nr:leucine--tRNA ligase [Oscillospiraceae bacterium]